MSSVINKVISPMEHAPLLFLVLYVSMVLLEVLGCFLFDSHINYAKALNISVISWLVSYTLVLVHSILPKMLRSIYRRTMYVISVVHFIVNLACICTYHQLFDDDIAAVIKGSNWGEIYEYLLTYCNITNVSLIVVAFTFFIVLFRYLKGWTIVFRTWNRIIICVLLFLSFAVLLRRPQYVTDLFVCKYFVFFSLEETPDLKKYKTSPLLSLCNNDTPDNIVIIFGESFSKSHSSLYGYEKNTNPYLVQLKADSSLLVYNNVTSPAINTINCFKSIMSTYRQEYGDSIKWYTCTTLLEILENIGYETFWISNQSKKGLYDNIIGSYSELCKNKFFIGDIYAGMKRRNLDGEVLPIISRESQNKCGKNAFFVHLMGSHTAFSHRYPKEFNIFKYSDYMEKPENQRQVLAEYDNSILYNDYVVYNIIEEFVNKEAVVLYFSDHGLDVFDTSNDYIGHARKTVGHSIVVAKQIPFMIWLSDKYKLKYDNDVERMKNSINKNFCTDNIIYTIMDIAGVRFKENKDVETFSLFN